jgi:hypothetical protein
MMMVVDHHHQLTRQTGKVHDRADKQQQQQ